MDFRPLKAAGVTQSEFAALLKVSRVTVSCWMRGAGGIHPMRVPHVRRMLQLVSLGVKDGKLPLQPMDRSRRVPTIKRILASYIRLDKD